MRNIKDLIIQNPQPIHCLDLEYSQKPKLTHKKQVEAICVKGNGLQCRLLPGIAIAPGASVRRAPCSSPSQRLLLERELPASGTLLRSQRRPGRGSRAGCALGAAEGRQIAVVHLVLGGPGARRCRSCSAGEEAGGGSGQARAKGRQDTSQENAEGPGSSEPFQARPASSLAFTKYDFFFFFP